MVFSTHSSSSSSPSPRAVRWMPSCALCTKPLACGGAAPCVRGCVRGCVRVAMCRDVAFYPTATSRHSFTRDRFRSHARPATRTHVGTWFTHAHAFTMSSMSAHMTSRAATQKVMMTKGRKATNARATRAVTRAGRFEAERTYIMIKCV